MRDVTNSNFGLVIAYVLPGFTTLVGVSFFSADVNHWLYGGRDGGPTIGSFLYVTLASLSAGLVASTIRWLIVDTLHHRTGIPRIDWNFAVLNERLAAFELLVESHYRYYQFYGNSMVAAAFTFIAFLFSHGWRSWGLFVAFLSVEVVFWLGSRNSFESYCRRAGMLLGERRPLVETP